MISHGCKISIVTAVDSTVVRVELWRLGFGCSKFINFVGVNLVGVNLA